MRYLIDGHNLIPKVPGLSLEAMNDEQQLIELLQEFCRRPGHRRRGSWLEVFFDQAPPGQAGTQRYGMVTAHFVRQGRTADQAILEHLKRLGKQARNYTVVSSDHQVQSGAHEAQAGVLTSEEFAALLVAGGSKQGKVQENRPQSTLSPQEVNEWLEIFGTDDEEEGEA
jgi:predicted RNA-binding protein with PIN domain